ncbi:hypothetical protein Nepgr_006439 [Nepenthes gracilis]|uniref:Uncharacterized protein n=1 Tax=Nepenthes gracilis TaxID=150966 RepID=A0AAD3S5B8_NEPGR|nr:hypothetical protein Nepgr_006439 [Nepenthes gracilis]
MEATGAADSLLFRGVYEGSISSNHTEVQRRPYHRNCGCALHKSRGTSRCPHGFPSITNVVSYPIRRSRSDGCLALASSAAAAPMVALGVGKASLEICDEDDIFD